ncbi:hypothetical protein HAX54_001014, partial [Datura stramonium]|nr:hypothetical protein [Datura stramonium]
MKESRSWSMEEVFSTPIGSMEVDVWKLSMHERQEFINKHFKFSEEDNEKFLRKFRNRIDRALPTLLNAARNIAESDLSYLRIRLAEKTKLTILKDASGIIKPS